MRAASFAALSHAGRSVSVFRDHAVGRDKQHRKTQINQIDIGEAEHDLAIKHDPSVEQVINEIHQRRVWRIQ